MPKKYSSLKEIPYKARPIRGQASRGAAVKKLPDLDYKTTSVRKGRTTIDLGVHSIDDAPRAVKAWRLQNRGKTFQVVLTDETSSSVYGRTYFADGKTVIGESLTLKISEKYRLSGSVRVLIVLFTAKKTTKKPAKKTTKKPAKKTTKKPAKKATKKPAKKTTKKPAKKATKKPAANDYGQAANRAALPSYGYAPYEPTPEFLKRRK